MKKRLLAILLAMCMMMGMLPTVALAVDEAQEPETTSTVLEETATSAEPETTPEPSEEPETEATYYLQLTHHFQFTVDGEEKSTQTTETLELTEADFVDGVCDLEQFANDVEQLVVTQADPLTIEDFDENRTCDAQITYGVRSGWKVVRATADDRVRRSIFSGPLGDGYKFVPANVVRIKVNYKYSNTGGLAGVDVANYQMIEIQPDKLVDGNYTLDLGDLPTKDGFRIVLDPDPLNDYLVQKPTGNETAEQLANMLESGKFDVDIESNTVYYYQETAETTDGPGTINTVYNNQYSTDYNQAWEKARTLTTDDYTATAEGTTPTNGATPLTNPKLKVTMDEAQLAKVLEAGTDLEITVYYRRNATWYTVNHWVPKDSANDDTAVKDDNNTLVEKGEYVLQNQDTLQGRVGAMTRAAARTGGDYIMLAAKPFSQTLIENQKNDDDGTVTGTVVNIYYETTKKIDVIFNTDYTYIPRQKLKLNESVDFQNIGTPKHTGYTFAGWRYLNKNATKNEKGEYNDNQYTSIDKDNPTLTITDDLLDKAKIENTGGTLALHLYPKWEPATTQVRVILWTEDLTGTDDVQATAEGGNAGTAGNYYAEKYENYKNAPVTHDPELGTSDSNYSNVGSFTVDVETDSSLLKPGADKELLGSIQTEVNTEFVKAMGQASGIDVANFYKQAGFEIVHGTEKNPTTASADGKTTIYVYFTRNIYELLFTYYGNATVGGSSSDYCVAVNTNGYSYSGGAAVPDGNLNFGYSIKHNDYQNGWMRADVQNAAGMPVPQTITIRAKYGADLRDVWPVARSEEQITSNDNGGQGGGQGPYTARMISWGTTDGKYCEDGQPGATGSSHAGEPTIMGTYAAMGSEIIADPTQPVTYNPDDTVNSGLRHNLVAYWFDGNISYYRNNHCYEVPDLDVSANDIKKVSIYDNDIDNEKNFLYLVPTTNETITKYGFTDLMKVSYANGQITYNDSNGKFYAVRAYNNKYYAVAWRVETVSSNAISAQNPSARLHMTRAKGNADHSTQHADTDGTYNGTTVGTADNPYDLYFYYNRDRYTITYMAPSNNISTANEVTLGTVTLPYGALVTKAKYGFALGYQDKNNTKNANGTNKYPWVLKDTDGKNLTPTAVCPDRAEDGTAVWKFKGWALGPTGVNMQWENSDSAVRNDIAAQAEQNFVLASNLRLYAIWDTPNYTVTFHLNGGQVGNATEGKVVEKVPANRIYTSTENEIPRPVGTSTSQFVGWYVANDEGQPVDKNNNVIQNPIGSEEGLQPFNFDEPITADKHVAAVWNPPIENTFDYKVYYVTKTLKEGDTSETVVYINGNTISQTGNDEQKYYVLKEVKNTNVAITGTELNVTPDNNLDEVEGYVPKDTNALLELNSTADDPNYYVIFYYDPITSNSHTVQFVLAGTEEMEKPTVVKKIAKIEAHQTVVTPKSAVAKELTEMGYALVNPNDDKNGYEKVTDGTNMKWLDKDGKAQGIITLKGKAIPAIVTYLVQPIDYTIKYEVADNTLDGAQAALDAITAAENTPVDSANGKNPTQYTNADTFTVTNPAMVYDSTNKKLYKFSHWTLGTNTTEGNNTTKTYNPLKVETGTVGNLTFVANWTEVTNKGDLTVTKTVEGTAGETERYFNFTVTLSAPITGTFGDMSFTDGVANFTLKHGESKIATGLPAGITYKVAETNADGYTVTKTGDTGAIQAGQTATAAFTNTKNYTPVIMYTLTYKSGDEVLKTVQYAAGSHVNLTYIPIKEGYTFKGWYKDKALTELVEKVTMNKDQTVYAKWEKTETPGDLNGDDHFAYVIGYPDGTVRPEANITRAEIATIFFRLLKDDVRDKNLTDTNNFTDVPKDAWYNKAISTMAALKIVNGYEDGSFKPDQPITRAELAVICVRFTEFQSGNVKFGMRFSDIDGHWAEAFINKAADLGWVMGDAEANTFRPEDPITRAEAMAMINRVLNRLPEKKEDLLDGMNVWPDNPSDQWYYLYVQEATNSHDFKRKADQVHETWTKRKDDPDWTQYQ